MGEAGQASVVPCGAAVLVTTAAVVDCVGVAVGAPVDAGPGGDVVAGEGAAVVAEPPPQPQSDPATATNAGTAQHRQEKNCTIFADEPAQKLSDDGNGT